MIILIGAIISLVFASIQSYKAWGVLPVIGIVLVGVAVTIFVPFGSIVTIAACLGIFSAARNAVMKRIMNEPDD